MIALIDFVLAHLPPPPARVLEVGCGEGALARALARHGYDVLAIDPEAPEGAIFRSIRLEELDSRERFDGALASASLHHIADLGANVDRVATALASGGSFIVDDFGWDLLDPTTAEWYEGQRRVLAAAGREPHGPAVSDWTAHHRDTYEVHDFKTMYEALGFRFAERHFERVPYLWRYLGGEQSVELEETLIAAGAIRPIGFRFVGIRRAPVR